MYVCLCVPVSVCVCLCVSVCMSVYVSVCVCVYVSVCLCVCVSVSLFVCEYVCLCVWVSVCLRHCVCVWVSVCLNVNVCVCVCEAIETNLDSLTEESILNLRSTCTSNAMHDAERDAELLGWQASRQQPSRSKPPGPSPLLWPRSLSRPQPLSSLYLWTGSPPTTNCLANFLLPHSPASSSLPNRTTQLTETQGPHGDNRLQTPTRIQITKDKNQNQKEVNHEAPVPLWSTTRKP